jgi:hypothetical protein
MGRIRDTCQECGSPPLPGKTRCQTCLEHHSLREAKRRQDRRDQGLCVPCGAPAVIDDDGVPMSYCDACRAKNDARRLAIKKKREAEKRRAERAERT